MRKFEFDEIAFPVANLLASYVHAERGGEYSIEVIDGLEYIKEVEGGEFIEPGILTRDKNLLADYVSIVDEPEEWDWSKCEEYINRKKLEKLCIKYGLPIYNWDDRDNGLYVKLSDITEDILVLRLLTQLVIAINRKDEKNIIKYILIYYKHPKFYLDLSPEEIDYLIERNNAFAFNLLANAMTQKKFEEFSDELSKKSIDQKIGYAYKFLKSIFDGHLTKIKLEFDSHNKGLSIYSHSIIESCYLQLISIVISSGLNITSLNICKCGGIIYGKSNKKRCNNCRRSTDHNRKIATIREKYITGWSIEKLSEEYDVPIERIANWVKAKTEDHAKA